MILASFGFRIHFNPPGPQVLLFDVERSSLRAMKY